MNNNIIIKHKEDITFVLNCNTGMWYVGKSDDEVIEDIKLYGIDSLPKESRTYETLTTANIISNDSSGCVEQPHSDKLSLLILDTTSRCNLSCKYCFVNAEQDGIDMSLEIALSAIILALEYSNCADTLTVEFSGGEPLLNFGLIKELIPQAKTHASSKEKSINFTIQTNGTLLTEEIAIFLKENNVEIGISMDGTEEEQNKYRVFHDGSVTYDIIKKNISKMRSLGCDASILSVVYSAEQYDSIIKFAIENDIKYIRTNIVMPIGRAEEYSIFESNEHKLSGIADKFLNVAHNALSTEKPVNDATLRFYLWNLLLWQPHMCFRSPCGAGKNQISVTSNGDIYPCQEWRNIRDTPIGNVLKGIPLKSILENSDRVKSIQARDTKKAEMCRECDWKMFCGICTREIYSKSPTMDKKIPQCDFQNKIFEGLIYEFAENSDSIRRFITGE